MAYTPKKLRATVTFTFPLTDGDDRKITDGQLDPQRYVVRQLESLLKPEFEGWSVRTVDRVRPGEE
jgi:hypothetical protein